LIISIIDDQAEIRYSVGKILKNQNHTIHKFDGQESYLVDTLQENGSDLLILDVILETDKTGIDLLREFREENFKIPVVLMTAYTTPENIIEASKFGVQDILQKPFDEDELIAIVNKYTPSHSSINDNQITQLKEKKFIGSFETMQDIYKKIGVCANNNLCVLVSGKTGTGKELIAELIHKNSIRNKSLFLAVNCASIPDELFESQLFGHEKGSFTSADNQHIGYAEQVKEGTLFLDEIGELNSITQSKLLRFLENRTFRRVGGNKEQHFKGRIVCATNINLKDSIENSTFREDLFFRLSMISIELPTLKQRKKDIPFLSKYFIGLANKELGTNIKSISKEALSRLENFEWSGNIRQLKNCVFNASLNATQETIEFDNFTCLKEKPKVKNNSLKNILAKEIEQNGIEQIGAIKEMIEKEILLIGVNHCTNLTKLSSYLGISRLTLRNKLKDFKIKY